MEKDLEGFARTHNQPTKESQLIRGILLTIAVCYASSLHSFGVNDESLPEKAARSDLIVTGEVVEIGTVRRERWDEVFAVVEIKRIYKGHAVSKTAIRVITSGAVAELAAVCCTVGEDYLFFLERAGTSYMSSNGYYGVYRISEEDKLFTGNDPAEFTLRELKIAVEDRL